MKEVLLYHDPTAQSLLPTIPFPHLPPLPVSDGKGYFVFLENFSCVQFCTIAIGNFDGAFNLKHVIPSLLA